MTTYVNVYGLPRANPYLPAQAAARAMRMVNNRTYNRPGLCDHVSGIDYGWGHTGEYSAALHWSHIPARLKHPGPGPVGALGFWLTNGRVSGGFGHVAPFVLPGAVASTDIKHNGYVDVVSYETIHRYWGNMVYVGWAAPYFPHGSAPFGPLQPGKPPVAPSAPVVPPRVDLSKVQYAAIHASADPGVKIIQKALKAAVGYTGLINGVWDKGTRAAYAAWQRKLGYVGSDADGIPGAKSLQVLAGRYHFVVVA
jgi:hypothetical protein